MILLLCDFWIIISSIGCFLSGIFTITLFFVGRKQIKKYINLGELDLYYKLKQDFSTQQSLILFRGIIGNTIGIGGNNGFPVLVDMGVNDLTDDLLNNIEDMWLFYDRGLITKNTIIEGYGTIIQRTFESPVIQEYIQMKRVSYNSPSLHTGLGILYNLINE